MNAMLNSISFGARVSRPRNNGQGEYTYEEVVKSYDDAIAKIQKQKESAIELDTFMRTDEKVQELVAQLPQDDEIMIMNKLAVDSSGEDLEVNNSALFYNDDAIANQLLRLGLSYDQAYGKASTLSDCPKLYSKNGDINKAGIVKWLENLVRFFKL